METAGVSSSGQHPADVRTGGRMGIRRQLVVAYVLLGVARVVIMFISEEMAPSVGLLDIVIAVSLAVGLWRGSRATWQVAVALEGLTLLLLLWLLAVPWGWDQVALVALVALRLAVLLQRPLRIRQGVTVASG
jgi:hypothetical protein